MSMFLSPSPFRPRFCLSIVFTVILAKSTRRIHSFTGFHSIHWSCLVPAAVVFRLVFCNRIRCASSSSYSHTGYGILRFPSSPGGFPRVHVLVSSAIVLRTIGYKIVKSTLRRSALSQEYFGLLECTPMRPRISYGLVFSFRLVHVLTAVCNNASFSFNFVSSSSVSTMVIRVLNHNPRRKLAGARS